MEVKASLNYYRMAPRKIRLVADSIRGKRIEEAKVRLSFFPKRSAQPLLKLLESAIANAKNNLGIKEENLSSFYIKKITVDEGPKLKRFRPVARGAAHEIQKKTSHINLVLEEKTKGEKTEANKETKEKNK
jgi:large subunit ribosomal protein L22